MERCLRALRLEYLDERVAPIRFLARGLDSGQGDTEPPPRLSFTFLEPKGSCGATIFIVHLLLLSLYPAWLIPARFMPRCPFCFTDHASSCLSNTAGPRPWSSLPAPSGCPDP